MQSGLNRVTLWGNVGSSALRYTTGGQPVLNIRLATNEVWTDRDGEVHEKTEWHTVTLWGKRAEAMAKHVQKGTSLIVEGKLQTTDYEKDGQKHYRTEVVALNVMFASPKAASEATEKSNSNGNGAHAGPLTAQESAAADNAQDDDIPF